MVCQVTGTQQSRTAKSVASINTYIVTCIYAYNISIYILLIIIFHFWWAVAGPGAVGCRGLQVERL
jgi:hypothetical protein